MHGLTGTGRLVRLALRTDRIKLPLWILALSAFMAANLPAVVDLYGQDIASRTIYATTTASSLVSRIFNGPISGTSIGEIVNNETLLFTALAMAFMSTLAVVRHTRQNEETGRTELISSAVVGRHASLTAAFLVVVGANVALSTLLALVYIAYDLPIASAIGTAAALGATGICFAAVAAVAAQISESARGANGLAAAAIGLAFILRAIGDSLGQLTQNGTAVVSAWPSWLSPLGWVQQLHAFTQNNWQIFGFFAVFFVATATLAFYFNSVRDIGLGMLPARKGPATAARSLLSPLGLARRLQRGTLRGWIIAILVGGLTIGLVVEEFSKLLTENPAFSTYIENLGGTGAINDVFFAAMMSLMAIAIGAYAVQALQRLRSEESGGQLEPLLGTSVSKPGWMLSHISYTIFGIVILLAVLGVSSGITYMFVTGASWAEAGRITGAALVYIPAVAVLAGFAIFVFGLLPRYAIVLAWLAFAFCLVIGEFGELLNLPQAVLNISPFTHTPAYPAAPIVAAPLVIVSAIAIALLGAGLWLFRRRDITTG